MTLRDYIEEAASEKTALISKKNHNKASEYDTAPKGNRGRDETGNHFLGKARKAVYRSDENEASSGSDQNRNTGNFFTKQRDANRNEGDYPNGTRRKDTTPTWYTGHKSANKYSDERLGEKSGKMRDTTNDAFLGKKRNATYRSDENDASNGSPSKERTGADLSFFTGRDRKVQK